MRLLILLLLATCLPAGAAAERSNVVVILIDDQGYGDIAAHGNPVVKTPALDRLHGESVRLTDFHVDPTCSPRGRACAVMTDRWRLVNGTELYDIEADPGQQTDLAAQQPDVASRLRADYEAWWASLEPVFAEPVRLDLGGVENPTTLMSHDWLMPGTTPSAWHHEHVRKNLLVNGPFMVRIVKAGRYRITPLRWPEYLAGPHLQRV